MKYISLIAAMLFMLIHIQPALASEANTASTARTTKEASHAPAKKTSGNSAKTSEETSKQDLSAPNWLVLLSTWSSIVFAVLGVVTTLTILCFVTNFKTDENENYKWKLAFALSEEVEITDTTVPEKKRKIFVASSSRLIAFIALIALVALLIGATPIIIWTYAKSGTMPGLDELSKFVIACAGLFLPYIANQARAAINK